MFEPSLDVEKPDDADKVIKNMHIEDIQLAQMTPVNANQTYREAFT